MNPELIPKDKDNAPEKRFTLSRAEFAQERLNAVREYVYKLKKDHPEVLSFCMFGSMTKGRAREASDIDGELFIDPEKVSLKVYGPETECHFSKDLYGNITGEIAYEGLRGDIAAEYIIPMRESLKAELSLTDEQLKHIRILPISFEIINRHLENLKQSFDRQTRYEQQLAEWEASNPEGKIPDIDALIAYWKRKPKLPGTPMPSSNLRAMFHLEIGGGIREYRKYLIEKLEGMGHVGEEMWRRIIESTEEMEQYMRTGTAQRYPRTLKDAKRVYGK
jgi:hypothetical protein